jgi:hypothetical protein
MKKVCDPDGVQSRTFGPAAAGEMRCAKPERTVGEPVECKQLAIDSPTGCPDQLHRLCIVQVELDDCAGDIPCEILAPDQIVRLVMIERIGLEEASVG